MSTQSQGRLLERIRIRSALLVVVMLAASLAFLAHSRPASGEAQPRASFEGSWVGNNSLGVHLFETATPLDPDDNRVALVLTGTADPTFGGMFPTATAISAFHGEAVRSGPRSFDFRKIALGVDADHRIVYFLESSGTKVFSDADHFHGTATISIFLASQDADGDGWVDEGEESQATIPYSFRLQRVKPGQS